MPIRFACSNCQQALSVPDDKAESEVKCPRCHRVVTAPTTDQGPLPPPSSDVGSNASELPPYEQFTVERSDSELVYAADEPSTIHTPEDQQLVAVPRRIVFIQGFLLGAIAIVFFIFGVVVGSHSTDQNAANIPRSCQVTGVITYTNSAGKAIPDADSVVLLLPVARRPDPKIPVQGLRISDRAPGPEHTSVIALRDVGGAYTRADDRGRFALRVPNVGRYFMLVVSQHAKRGEDVQPKTRDLAQIGRYLLPASDLIGQQRYSWLELNLRDDRSLDVAL